MSAHKKVKYTDGPMGDIKIIPDFLPSPENLVRKESASSTLTKENSDASAKQNKIP
ncbi:MAG: hypothetical protein K2Q33_04515 [Gammaproteobacteria bacterium]|nr:hypothetical protein [Gammaproteobacteria bacterium]